MRLDLNRLSPLLRDRLQRLGRRLGLEVKISGPRSRADLRLAYFLREREVDVVLDVGANRGQFAQELFGAGYRARVVSFEPQPGAHQELTDAAAAAPFDWQVPPAVALSDANGSATFLVAAADTTSSLLPPTDALVEMYGAAKTAREIEVRTARLDDIAHEHLTEKSRGFLKLDVQGAEMQVISGGLKTTARMLGVLVEVCLDELYVGQSRLHDIMSTLAGQGFELHDVTPAFRDPRTLKLSAIDLLYMRPVTDA
ncbi:MAG: FkbM family methyltransferase [Polyangiaceae bacterium]|nr:FkbM family methyltransferase [Polyangiaceae bacterium]MCW5791039.1 FkbM family methyltransferase [Polyangiaceae bacterium]